MSEKIREIMRKMFEPRIVWKYEVEKPEDEPIRVI